MQTLSIGRRFAVFSDVHGNLPGLEAVLADLDRRGMADVLCLGDLVGYGPFPNEVVALVRERGIPTLMGNYDKGIGFALGDCGCVYRTDEQRAEGAASLAWTDRVTSAQTRALLRGLADRFVLETPAGALLAVHGSPRRINEYLFEDRPERALARIAEADPYRAILFGHTHLPYVREVAHGRSDGAGASGWAGASGGAGASGAAGETTLFVNVGSAGRPRDGDWRACYALVDPARLAADSPAALSATTAARSPAKPSTAEPAALGDPVTPAAPAAPTPAYPAVEFVRVPYDYERLSAALAATDLITSFEAPPAAAGAGR